MGKVVQLPEGRCLLRKGPLGERPYDSLTVEACFHNDPAYRV